MKKKGITFIVFILLAISAVTVYASVSCELECQRHGGSYWYCKEICGK